MCSSSVASLPTPASVKAYSGLNFTDLYTAPIAPAANKALDSSHPINPPAVEASQSNQSDADLVTVNAQVLATNLQADDSEAPEREDIQAEDADLTAAGGTLGIFQVNASEVVWAEVAQQEPAAVNISSTTGDRYANELAADMPDNWLDRQLEAAETAAALLERYSSDESDAASPELVPREDDTSKFGLVRTEAESSEDVAADKLLLGSMCLLFLMTATSVLVLWFCSRNRYQPEVNVKYDEKDYECKREDIVERLACMLESGILLRPEGLNSQYAVSRYVAVVPAPFDAPPGQTHIMRRWGKGFLGIWDTQRAFLHSLDPVTSCGFTAITKIQQSKTEPRVVLVSSNGSKEERSIFAVQFPSEDEARLWKGSLIALLEQFKDQVNLSAVER